jgi:hypothetical protein
MVGIIVSVAVTPGSPTQGSADSVYGKFMATRPIGAQASRTYDPKMSQNSRREFLTRAGAAAVSLGATQAASAKAGQFGKIEIFGAGASSPYATEGLASGDQATYGYKKSGEYLAKGYQDDVAREKASFEKSVLIYKAQQPNIDSKTWWLARDNLRGQASVMKSNMLVIQDVSNNKQEAKKTYDKFWRQINDLDFALKQKEQALSTANYKKALDTLDSWKSIAM